MTPQLATGKGLKRVSRKPKPPSNAEIYNALSRVHEDVCLSNRLLSEFLRRQSEIERRVAILERTKEPKHYKGESE